MFLINSRQGYFRCGPACAGQALFRSYGRFFAEFLEDLSLVHLRLLASPTCVGFRYGFPIHSASSADLEDFLGRLLCSISHPKGENFHTDKSCQKAAPRFSTEHPSLHKRESNNAQSILIFVPSSKNKEVTEY